MTVSACALVVGIEEYADLIGGLNGRTVTGAVADALAFQAWLIDAARLDQSQIRLHLSPASAHAAALPATVDAVKKSIKELRAGAVGGSERLFFYFSGHGFQFGGRLTGDPEDALAFADFTDLADGGDRTLQVGEIQSILRGLGPGEQYFFLDCCRNSVTFEQLSTGRVGINRLPEPGGPPDQFTLFATGPGRTASVAGDSGRSDFNTALISSLGDYSILRWLRADKLVLSFASLTERVTSLLEGTTTQLPRQDISAQRDGALLTCYPPAPGPRVKFAIEVEGLDASNPAEVFVEVATPAELPPPHISLADGRGEVLLLPAQYTVAVQPARGFCRPPAKTFWLRNPTTLSFRVVEPAGTRRGPGLESLPTFGSYGPFDPLAALPQVEVAVVVPAAMRDGDPEERLVLRDASGRDMGAGQWGSLGGTRAMVWMLKPGDYSVHVVEAGITEVVSEISVEPERNTLAIDLRRDPPSDPLRAAFATHVGHSSGWLLPSEALGAIASNRLSTWLSIVAGYVVARRPELHGLSLPTWGFAEGVLVVAALDEPLDARIAAGHPLLEHALQATAHAEVPGLSFGLVAAPPGDALLSWSVRGRRYALGLQILPDHVTTVVLVDRDDAASDDHTESIYLLHGGFAATEHPAIAMRWLEATQRRSRRGELVTEPGPRVDEPITQLLQAILASRTGDTGAPARAEKIVRKWPDLPDAHAFAKLAGAAGTFGRAGLHMLRHSVHVLADEALRALETQLPTGVSADLLHSGPWVKWRRRAW